ncbi:hypothetical protein SmJEL517_g00404 [Synchytrium microbalum]|uniref:Mitochondrial chaperone BCS1 n=1 Tax=Synchytrium microbalum TaxID=1806994 RepID=A0A507CJJ5_9FUNG|nr:uncharacterized protein SmJEL517_g00404 [Synchytrium microbalum]TPX37985.1 hypothetical protein SmJEL517_g00404 [Synchytrium microbalum]
MSDPVSLIANPYFSAGFGLIGVTAGLAVLRQGAVYGMTLARRHFLVTLEIPSKDASYSWVLAWLSSQREAASKGQKAGLTSMGMSHQLSVETTYSKRDDGSALASFVLAPGPGSHYFRYKRAWFKVERIREKAMIDLKSGTPWETITFTTLSRDRPLLSELLKEATELAMSKQTGKTIIYTSMGPEWRPFGRPRSRRPLASVILDEGISDRIITDVQRFLKMGQWYQERGIPYRRGYLLYGPPGSGKSSFIQALAGDLHYNICVLNLSERGMTDDRLNHLLSHAPPRSIILLEDVDAAFPSRTATAMSELDRKQGFTSMLTFSGLLNALDGVTSAEERIIFMTTNHVVRLDPALIRPGRVDVKHLVGAATPFQIRSIFLRFYGSDKVDKADIFVNALAGRDVSMAQLQGHFVLYQDDVDQAVANAKSLVS